MGIRDLDASRSQLSTGVAGLHSSTSSGDPSYVTNDPATLAGAAGCDLDTYSLARAIASEGYSGGAAGYTAAVVAIGQACLNVAARNGITITAQCLKAKGAAAGHYGEQQGREFATSKDPSPWHVAVARAILSGEVPDLAFGAHQFLEPSYYAGKRNPDHPTDALFSTVMTRWHNSYKWAWAGSIPTVNPYHLMLFYPESDATVRADSLAEVLAIYDRGKAGNAPAAGDPDYRMTPEGTEEPAESYSPPDGLFNTICLLLIAVVGALVGG